MTAAERQRRHREKAGTRLLKAVKKAIARSEKQSGYFSVYINPHERREALDVCSDVLSAEQRDEIKNAPDNAVIRIEIQRRQVTSVMAITPEMIRNA